MSGGIKPKNLKLYGYVSKFDLKDPGTLLAIANLVGNS